MSPIFTSYMILIQTAESLGNIAGDSISHQKIMNCSETERRLNCKLAKNKNTLHGLAYFYNANKRTRCFDVTQISSAKKKQRLHT